MNSITFAGVVGKDAELRSLNNGEMVCKFSVADSQGKEKPPIWWNCSLFGKRAESLSQYILKGSKVTVFGSVSERSWMDAGGVEKKSMEVRVVEITLQGSNQSQAPLQKPIAAKAPDISDDDIPW